MPHPSAQDKDGVAIASAIENNACLKVRRLPFLHILPKRILAPNTPTHTSEIVT